MNLLDLFVRVGVEDEASGRLEGISSGAIAKATVMGQAMYDALKFGVSKIADVTQALVSGALEGYGAYEQLTGGMKKLYGDASDTVIADAQRAYKEVGISANKYMEGVAGFSAALMNSVKDDSQEAARLSNMAMKDIADNANTFGKYSVDELTEVYQALAKGNYQTLDNLNLGFGGTKKGMQQLIDKANELRAAQGETSKLTIDSYADIVTAIHTVQEEMSITGTTENEAMNTIEGSINSVKAAWENLLTSIGSGDPAMIQEAVTGIVDGIFGTFNEELGRREGGVINNVLPVLQNVGSAIVNEMPAIAQQVYDEFFNALQGMTGIDLTGIKESISDAVDTVRERLEALMEAAENFASGFGASFDLQGAQDALVGFQTVLDGIWAFINDNILANSEAIGSFLGEVGNVLTTIATAATELMTVIGPYVPFIAALVGAFGVLMPIINGVVGVVGAISGAVTFLTTVVGPALGMIGSVQGAVAALVTVLGGPVTVIAAIGAAVIAFIATNEEAREAILNAWNAVVDFFMHIPENVQKAWDDFKSGVENMIKGVSEKWEGFKAKVGEWMDGIKSGIEEKWNAVVEWVTGVPDRITEALGDLGKLLFGAGEAVINGLWEGMSSVAEGLFGWVGSIADTISNLKGPLPYDKKVLVDNGVALMTGLKDGIEQGYEKNVKPAVKAVAKDIDTYYGMLTDDRNYVSGIAYFGKSSDSGVYTAAGMTSAAWGSSSGGNLLSGIATDSSGTGSSTRATWSSSSGKSTTQKVRDEAVISVLRSILAAMPKELKLDTKGLAERLAPDMNVALGRL